MEKSNYKNTRSTNLDQFRRKRLSRALGPAYRLCQFRTLPIKSSIREFKIKTTPFGRRIYDLTNKAEIKKNLYGQILIEALYPIFITSFLFILITKINIKQHTKLIKESQKDWFIQ